MSTPNSSASQPAEQATEGVEPLTLLIEEVKKLAENLFGESLKDWPEKDDPDYEVPFYEDE